MKKLTYLFLLLFAASSISAQQIVPLDENAPYSDNGIEYGYSISNERSSEIKGDDFERYEVNLYVTNKSGCIRIIPFRNGWNNNTTTSTEDIMIAEFNCLNATGKKLTAKKGTVSAKPWYVNVRITDNTQKGGYRLQNAQAGYAIRNGQTLTTRIIVIVPKGERPKMNCRVIYLPTE